jgi:hypothetical protein
MGKGELEMHAFVRSSNAVPIQDKMRRFVQCGATMYREILWV